MKNRIGLCILFSLFLAGGVTSVEAIKPLVEAQETSNAIVPNVTGIPSDVALQILQMAGLHAEIQRGSSRSLIVDSQEPRAGALLAVGSKVVLAVGGSVIKTSAPQAQVQPPVIFVTQPSVPAASDVQPFLAWYPKHFLNGKQDGQSDLYILGRQSKGQSNIFGAKPLNMASDGTVPIIMAPTGGWQYGWVPYGSYAPQQSSPQEIRPQPETDSGYSILNVPSDSVGRSVSVPPVMRLLQSDAEIAFKKKGLEIGKVTQIEDYQLRSGLIVKQSPAAQSFVAVGTKVDLWVVK